MSPAPQPDRMQVLERIAECAGQLGLAVDALAALITKTTGLVFDPTAEDYAAPLTDAQLAEVARRLEAARRKLKARK